MDKPRSEPLVNPIKYVVNGFVWISANDIRSAVEWLLEEIPSEEPEIKELVKRAFEEVIKDREKKESKN